MIQGESSGFIFAPDCACQVQTGLLVRVVMARAEFLFSRNIFLVFHVSKSSDFLWDCRILFQRLSKCFKLGSGGFWWTGHWGWSLLDSWFFLTVGSRAWNFCLVPSKPLSYRLEFGCACWVDFDDNAVTIWNCFDVWLYDIFPDVILSRAGFYDGFFIKEGLSESGWVERSAVFWLFIAFLIKVLSWTCGVGQFGDFVYFSLGLKDESHGLEGFR